jgi:hypothetical protein
MRLLSLIVMLLVAAHAPAATLDRSALVGTWTTPAYEGSPLSNLLFGKPPGSRLEIGSELSVRLVRRFEDGKVQVLSASPHAVSFHEDLIIVKLPMRNGSAKLVLAGWSGKGAKRLFGHLLLYDGNGLFNGIPVSFVPVAGR